MAWTINGKLGRVMILQGYRSKCPSTAPTPEQMGGTHCQTFLNWNVIYWWFIMFRHIKVTIKSHFLCVGVNLKFLEVGLTYSNLSGSVVGLKTGITLTPSVYSPNKCLPCAKVIDHLTAFFPGPAQVPMMSPNGSVPPIYVPPGYVSQVILLYCSLCAVSDWQLVHTPEQLCYLDSDPFLSPRS